ncbi:hypothetical protein ACOI1H_25150 [Loktanella sp. DJP18]|uniref:hypothetical protein n=1 Tax=Loktanella sp. DJP18 TaxID=3409788 RepID=UPI003BB6D899
MTPEYAVPILNDVSQLIGAVAISRAAIVGIIKPKGHPFSVTAKGGDRSKVVVQWRLMAPFAAVLFLSLLGLVIGIVSDRFAFSDAGDGKWVVLFWSIYNVIVLSVTVITCIELPRSEKHIADVPERATFHTEGRSTDLWITSLTSDTVRLRGIPYPEGTRGLLQIDDVGQVQAYVIAQLREGARLHLLPTEKQREDLMLRFYADDSMPGVARVRSAAMIADIARRFSSSTGRA